VSSGRASGDRPGATFPPRSFPPSALAALAVVLVAIGATVAIGMARRGRDERARCGPGFIARAARCVVAPDGPCPSPLVQSSAGCDAPDVRVAVPETTLVVGPSDWEAEGRVAPRTIHAGPFRIDAFEVTERRWLSMLATLSNGGRPTADVSARPGDPARAAAGMARAEADAFCARWAPGGRLPTEDEWMIAAVAGASAPIRYPWGDTGAVCRRGAWGLQTGPCSAAGDGPDTVGSHLDGDSALGLHDLAGNVAEWVAPAAPAERAERGLAKGGSWQTALAPELRVWARLELDPAARDPRVGFRCVYPTQDAQLR